MQSQTPMDALIDDPTVVVIPVDSTELLEVFKRTYPKARENNLNNFLQGRLSTKMTTASVTQPYPGALNPWQVTGGQFEPKFRILPDDYFTRYTTGETSVDEPESHDPDFNGQELNETVQEPHQQPHNHQQSILLATETPGPLNDQQQLDVSGQCSQLLSYDADVSLKSLAPSEATSHSQANSDESSLDASASLLALTSVQGSHSGLSAHDTPRHQYAPEIVEGEPEDILMERTTEEESDAVLMESLSFFADPFLSLVQILNECDFSNLGGPALKKQKLSLGVSVGARVCPFEGVGFVLGEAGIQKQNKNVLFPRTIIDQDLDPSYILVDSPHKVYFSLPGVVK